MKKIGTLYVAKSFDILMNEDGEFFTKDSTNEETLSFSFEEAVMYLCKPWSDNAVSYYEDELGVHYHCIVYDWVDIDIYAENITALFLLFTKLLTPSDDLETLLCDRIKDKNDNNML